MRFYDVPPGMRATRVKNKDSRPFAPKKFGDVGHDLYASRYSTNANWFDRLLTRIDRAIICVVWPFTNRNIGSGIFLSLPMELWVKLEARSSTGKKQMSIDGGVIDPGYRGELFAVLSNKSLLPRVIRHGERYAQAIFHHAVRPMLVEVEEFDDSDTSDRGDSGFGSSGQ